MKSIGFKNFKRFAECPDLELSGVTFLVGKNNSGKTTFTHAARLAADFIDHTSRGGDLQSIFSFEVGNQTDSKYRGYNSVLHRDGGIETGKNNRAIEFCIDYGEFILQFGVDKKYNPFGFIEAEIRDWVDDSYYSQYPDATEPPIVDGEWLRAEIDKRMDELKKNHPDRFKALKKQDQDGKGRLKYIYYYDKTNRIAGLLDGGLTKLVFNDFPEEEAQELERLSRLLETLSEEDRPSVQDRVDELLERESKSKIQIVRNGVISRGLEKNSGHTLPEFYSIDCLAGHCLAGESDLPDDGMPYDRITEFLDEADHRKRLEGFKELFSVRLYHQLPSCARHIGHYTDDEQLRDMLFRQFRNNNVHGETDLMACVSKWVKELEIGDGIDMRPDTEAEEADAENRVGTKYVECFVRKTALMNGKKLTYEVPFDSLGVGSRQLIILLVTMALVITEARHKSYPTLVTVEEPEQNLHPAIQSRLADMFLDFYEQFKCQCIIETHSEYIIRRSQVLVAEGIKNKAFTLEDNPFKVYYFPDDETSPYDMEYKENGRFGRTFGPGFLDVAGNSNLALLDLSNLTGRKK